MTDALAFSLSTIATPFFVVDPMAAAPIFITMTADDSAAHKRRTALRAAIGTLQAVLPGFAAALRPA